MQENWNLHLVNVPLTGQVSIYNHQTRFSEFLTSYEGPCKCKPMFDPYIEILRKMAVRPVNFDIDYLTAIDSMKSNRALF